MQSGFSSKQKERIDVEEKLQWLLHPIFQRTLGEFWTYRLRLLIFCRVNFIWEKVTLDKLFSGEYTVKKFGPFHLKGNNRKELFLTVPTWNCERHTDLGKIKKKKFCTLPWITIPALTMGSLAKANVSQNIGSIICKKWMPYSVVARIQIMYMKVFCKL